MKLSEALKRETQRENPDTWNKIYLNRDGKFWHAYQWSAWLMKMVACTEEMQRARCDEKMLSAVRYQTKNSGEYIIVGFPIESIGKYLPEYVSMTPVADGDGDIVVEIQLTETMTQASYEEVRNAFREWHDACPMKEQKPRQDRPVPTAVQMAQGRGGMFHILSQVLSYPLEQKTPTDNIEFISQLKQQLVALL
jgi:hypothetical protein